MVRQMTRRSKKSKPSWGGGGFAALPHHVIESSKFAMLSPQATKLLIDLLAQYKGSNNGDLCAAMTTLKPRGWKSSESLQRAKRELVQTGFLVVSRKGGRHKPDLYAITFYRVNECLEKNGVSKIEISPTLSPTNDWLRDTSPPNLDDARKRKKKADLIELQAHLDKNPDDPYAEHIKLGIRTLKAQIN